MTSELREFIKDKQRIVIKIGSSSLQHKETGDLDYTKLDVLCRELCNIRNQGKDVILVELNPVNTQNVKNLNKEQPQTANILSLESSETENTTFNEHYHKECTIYV